PPRPPTGVVLSVSWRARGAAGNGPARGGNAGAPPVSAGSDFPVGQFGAMRSVWGMTTRQTVIGVKGPEHAITYDEALTLHTTQAAHLTGEDRLRGTLTPGRWADFTVWDRDPANASGEELRDLKPVQTFVGGAEAPLL
ncbi:amidohydrolase family protein, partial [Streptomyces sp. NPDC059627]